MIQGSQLTQKNCGRDKYSGLKMVGENLLFDLLLGDKKHIEKYLVGTNIQWIKEQGIISASEKNGRGKKLVKIKVGEINCHKKKCQQGKMSRGKKGFPVNQQRRISRHTSSITSTKPLSFQATMSFSAPVKFSVVCCTLQPKHA